MRKLLKLAKEAFTIDNVLAFAAVNGIVIAWWWTIIFYQALHLQP